MIYKSIIELVGNTPLLKIDPSVHGLKNIDLYAKLEMLNPFASIKDRTAWGMLEPGLEEIKKKNLTVLESSSGNTAKALSVYCSLYNIPFKTITNRIKLPEVRMTLQLLGGELEEKAGLSECPDPTDPEDAVQAAQRLADSQPDKYIYLNQHFNKNNVRVHYEKTAQEIYDDLGPVDYFSAFLGTCGSSRGIGEHLRKINPDTSVIGVVSSIGNYVPGGRNLNELYEVGLFEKSFYDFILDGTNQEAIDGMLTLIKRTGILCGPTTGLIYHATLQKLREIDSTLDNKPRKKAVFLACDRMEPYISYLEKYRPGLFSSKSVFGGIENLSEEEIRQAEEIEPSELEQNLQDYSVIDIRGNFAYSTGHIKNSINIMDSLLTEMIESGNTFPQNRKIIIVCRIGDISKKYASYLNMRGYEAASLKGGITEWKKQNLSIEKNVRNIPKHV